ncbi:uncharacterized protein KY384_008607 [Bacidia gigantensis]|uniref:uncharacterized protein n=1 Tax=Bacidia gigantensis TaxID=2732470 RepID=UPI001D05559B|nr:uncharacterized protein KY384_008607 [Bacidia gigantensis]KAG8527177.1 hypothetical protein KY384_008607 [Bacidia gigantensis]
MLAGQPPFQSTSQHEIYKRARNVEYSWPEESKRGNDIPDEAKDLVARLLKVDAERRPDPDQIIGHRFFSMNGGDAIPAHMEGYFRTETPRYLDRQARPRGDVILPGTERLSLRTLAKDCGVGCLPGDLAPQSAVGADMDLSLYKECATEEAAGLGPVVPLPEDVVYTSKYSLRTWLPKQIEEVRKVDPRLYERTEEAIDPLARPKAKFVHDNPMANLEKARRAPVQSHAATLRAAHIRKPSNPRSELQPPAVERNELNTKANTIGSNRARRGLMNELPVRPLSSANTVTGQSTDAPERKSRTTRSKQVVVLDEEPNPSEGKTAHPMTKDQYVDATSPDPDRKRREMAAKTRARIASNVQKELAVDVEGKGMAKAPTARRQRSKPHTTTLIDPNEAFKFVPNTKPEDVMRTLSEMHTRLDKSLQRTQQQNHYSNVRAIEAKSSTFKQRPVVVKWVDYTNKYGIGFILANGTVGCLFKGEKTTLPTSIVVADSERHFSNRRLSSYAEKQSILSSHSLPVEYVEDTGAEGLKRVLCPPLKMQNLVSPSLTEPERSDLDASSFDLEKRRNLLLWDKFGRYMTQSLGHPEGEPEAAPTTRKRSNTATSATLFVKFYQRLGNVGIWGFSDSSFQFNFPDHTKLLLSPSPSSSAIDDLWADFYHLPIPAAKKLSAGQKIDPHDLAERGVLCYPVPIMLSGKLERRDFADVLHANQFERKLEFVRDLLAVWVSEGGIGCMGEKRGWRWEGMSEESGKSVWVTVGAKGGMRGMRGSDRGGKGGGGIGGSGWKVPGRGACMIIRSIFRCLDERCLVLGWTSVGVWGCLEF